MNVGGVNYKSMVISCSMADLSAYANLQEQAIQNIIAANNTLRRLPFIQNSMSIITDVNQYRLLLTSLKLTNLNNYSSILQAGLARYTGFYDANSYAYLNSPDLNDTSYPNFNVSISADPTNPTLLTKNEIHIRTNPVGYNWFIQPGFANIFKFIFYFDTDSMSSAQNAISTSVGNAQTQVTLLALAIIVIIYAVVMCISYQ